MNIVSLKPLAEANGKG